MSSLFLRLVFALAILPTLAFAQGFTTLARLLPQDSQISEADGEVSATLALTAAVPYRSYALSDPDRWVFEFRKVDWGGLADIEGKAETASLRASDGAAGWSVLEFALDRPMTLETVQMRVLDRGAMLDVRLLPTDAETFAALVEDGRKRLSQARPVARPVPSYGDPRLDDVLRIALDPGHGGIDRGALGPGVEEADLTLIFARELRDRLRRSGVEVVLTRDADIFVSLPDRRSIARAAGADALVSLHADSLAEGEARGATVYALSGRDADRASERLTQGSGRDDLIGGADLTGTDDDVAMVLLDMARRETAPRSLRLSRAIIEGIGDAGARLNSNPTRSGHFAVLRGADIPAVLVEVGFISSDRDRAELLDPKTRARLIEGLATGILAWAEADAVEASLVRQ